MKPPIYAMLLHPRIVTRNQARALVILLALAVLLLATGCAQLPSVQMCDAVDYKRRGDTVDITAHCRILPSMPIGVPGM